MWFFDRCSFLLLHHSHLVSSAKAEETAADHFPVNETNHSVVRRIDPVRDAGEQQLQTRHLRFTVFIFIFIYLKKSKQKPSCFCGQFRRSETRSLFIPLLYFYWPFKQLSGSLPPPSDHQMYTTWLYTINIFDALMSGYNYGSPFRLLLWGGKNHELLSKNNYVPSHYCKIVVRYYEILTHINKYYVISLSVSPLFFFFFFT